MKMTEQEVRIAKASPIAGESPQDVRIEITGEPPEFHNMKEKDWHKKYDAFYNDQAATLGRALLESLPGATIDRLIVFLLTQKASYFRVPYVEPQEERRMGELLEACRPFVIVANSADGANGHEENWPLGGMTISNVRKLRDAYNKFLK